MKYLQEKILDLQNTKKKKRWTHKIVTRNLSGHTKAQWQDETRSMRSTMARDPRNLR